MLVHIPLRSLSMCGKQLHVIVQEVHFRHQRVLNSHRRPVETPYDSMLDYVAKCCIDGCIGSHRRCRVHWRGVISMTYTWVQGEDRDGSIDSDSGTVRLTRKVNTFKLDLINPRAISVHFHIFTIWDLLRWDNAWLPWRHCLYVLFIPVTPILFLSLSR